MTSAEASCEGTTVQLCLANAHSVSGANVNEKATKESIQATTEGREQVLRVIAWKTREQSKVMEAYRSVVTVREHGDFLVERQIQLGANRWTTIDRYKTDSLLRAPLAKERMNGRKKRREGTDKWITKVIAACSQPSAEVHIDIPPVPSLEPTREARLELACNLMNDKIALLTNVAKQTPCPCSACTKERQGCQEVQSN